METAKMQLIPDYGTGEKYRIALVWDAVQLEEIPPQGDILNFYFKIL